MLAPNQVHTHSELSQAVLSLDIEHRPILADVAFGDNTLLERSATQWLNQTAHDTPFVLCWGGVGVGKTLLCQALAQQSTALYLSPQHSVAQFADAVARKDTLNSVVIDDIHRLNADQARLAFDLFNAFRESHNTHGTKRWWAASTVPPANMHSVLPDLASRLSWGLVLEMTPLGDDDSVRVLQRLAHRLGFELPTEAAHYLLLRLERNLGVLAKHLGSLNHYLLSIKKPLNSHWVQQWYSQLYLPFIQTKGVDSNNSNGSSDPNEPTL